MCLRVFIRDEKIDDGDAAALEHGASRLGAAFQNINFLRDLADDTTRLGRSYLGTADHLEDRDRMAGSAPFGRSLLTPTPSFRCFRATPGLLSGARWPCSKRSRTGSNRPPWTNFTAPGSVYRIP